MQSPTLLPPLSLAQRRLVEAQATEATAALQATLLRPIPSAADFGNALDEGARFETLAFSSATGQPWNLWEKLLNDGRLDLFETLLAADAQRPEPDARTAAVVSAVAAHPDGAFLNALLSYRPPLNRCGRTPFLAHQEASGLVGAIVGGNDAALDRLLNEGADPSTGLLAPRVSEGASRTANPKRPSAPLTLLHLAVTPHAVRRLIAAGLDPDAPDTHGRSALERVFDALALAERQRSTTDSERQMAIRLVNALLDAGANPKGAAGRLPPPWCWNVLVGAAQAGLTPLVESLLAQGMAWPPGFPPQGPCQTLALLDAGIPLPLEAHGSSWMASWMETPSVWEDLQAVSALRALTLRGLDPDGIDPATHLTPLLIGLQTGNHAGLVALAKAGNVLQQSPGDAWPAGTTWYSLLQAAFSKATDSDTCWTDMDLARWDAERDVAVALAALGQHPALLADIERRRLDRSTDPASGVPTAKKRF